MNNISISKLQKYIKEQDYSPTSKEAYFLKLAEEVGELSRAMRKNATPATESEFKGTIEEELYDVIYYALAIANCYDIEVENWIYIKEKLNDEKYKRNHADSLNKEQITMEEIKNLRGIVRSDIDDKLELERSRDERYAYFN